jgi:hypothetical protein
MSKGFKLDIGGGTGGVFLAVGGLIAWVALPLLIALRRFKSKDL